MTHVKRNFIDDDGSGLVGTPLDAVVLNEVDNQYAEAKAELADTAGTGDLPMDASNVRSGTLAAARGGTGQAGSSAKGDLLVGDASGGFGKLGVGTNGQALVADSAQTLGAKWATFAASPAPLNSTNNTVSGQSIGDVLRCTSAAAFELAALHASDIPDLSATYLKLLMADDTVLGNSTHRLSKIYSDALNIRDDGGVLVQNLAGTDYANILCKGVLCGDVYPHNDNVNLCGAPGSAWNSLYLGTAKQIRSNADVQFYNQNGTAYQNIDALALKLGGTSIINSSGALAAPNTTLPAPAASTRGGVALPASATNLFYRDDGSWALPSTTADVPLMTFYLHDYANLQAAVDAAKGQHLVLDANINVATAAVLGDSSYNCTRISGVARASITITATASIPEGVFQVRADNVTFDDFTIDCNNQTNTVGIQYGRTATNATGHCYKTLVRDVTVLNATGAAMRLGEYTDYLTIDHCRMMDGNVKCIDLVPGNFGGTYNNGHVYIVGGCELSGTNSCISYTAAGGGFTRCIAMDSHFNDSHLGTWMVQWGSICYCIGCDFETNAGGIPSSGIIAFDRYGQGCINCFFSCGNLSSGYVVNASSSYSPYIFEGCYIDNPGTGMTLFQGSGAHLIGANMTVLTNTHSATIWGSGIITGYMPHTVTAGTAPTMRGNGDVQLWHDTSAGKYYLVAQVDGVAKKVELT